MEEILRQIKVIAKAQKDLQDTIAKFYDASAIPLEIIGAFKARLLVDELVDASNTADPAPTHAVNEGGAASYNVAKAADGLIVIQFGGNTYKVPFYL